MEASREIFWNIPAWGAYLLYLFGFLTIGALIYAIRRRLLIWKIGKPDKRTDNLSKRILDFISAGIMDGLFHRRFFRDPYAGIMHYLLFGGALLLLLATALDVINHYVVHFLYGNVYLTISFLSDFGGLAMIIGAIMAIVRRYIQKPKQLHTIADDAVAMALILAVVITGFFIEGFRMIAAVPEGLSQPEYYVRPEWSMWSFGGYFIAGLFAGIAESARVLWYQILWVFHAVLALGAIYYVCFSFMKLSHIIISPINVFLKTSKPNGALTPINLEEAETFGVSKIQDFTWKQLFDLDACTNCGRCEDRCPANFTGKPLSPRKVIQDLKAHMLEEGPHIIKSRKVKQAEGDASQSPESTGHTAKTLIGEVITEEELWSCTTCRACQDICPVSVEHIDKIVDMRRNLVLEQAKMPETSEAILKCLETRGHTCRGTTLQRTDWMNGLDIKTLAEDSDVDIIYFPGCAAELEERNMKVAIAFAKLLKAAGVKFAVPGDEETCCGEPARRLGNEYLFQMQAMRNIEMFKNYKAKRIVTTCPHCFNTLKNEYPQFDGSFEVIHHSQFLAELIQQGRLKPATMRGEKFTIHDSCYLGRHNGIYDEPRKVLRSAAEQGFIEMERSRNNGFCCGGGGGRFWMEERGTRISVARIEQILETKADAVASACPYCLQMFEDAIKAKEAGETLKAYDIAEIMASTLDSK